MILLYILNLNKLKSFDLELLGAPAYPGRWPERALGRTSHCGLFVHKILFAGSRDALRGKRTPYVENGRPSRKRTPYVKNGRFYVDVNKSFWGIERVHIHHEFSFA